MDENKSRALAHLAEALSRCNDPELMEDFLMSLLTPRELHDVSFRWELVNLIQQGVSQRKIANQLGVSLCKITRGSKELKKEGSPFNRMIHLSAQEWPHVGETLPSS